MEATVDIAAELAAMTKMRPRELRTHAPRPMRAGPREMIRSAGRSPVRDVAGSSRRTKST